MRDPNTPKYFISRAWIYSKEMFPVLIYLPYVIALYGCVNFVVQILSGDPVVIDTMAIVGMISAFFMMLLMRTFDDLKDIEIDIELFPHRATARKAVLKSDIVAISLISFLVLLNTNIFFGQSTLPVFAIMISYCLLTFKWFFAEQFHRNHIFITMMDHQPIPYVINFFLIHTALATGAHYEPFSSTHLILWLIVSLPVTAWEVSRKIRSADMETQYETFSMVVGVKTATAIPLICLTATGLMSLHIGSLLHFSPWFFAINIAILAMVLFVYLRFFFRPIKENNILTNTALVTTTAYFTNLLVNTVLTYAW
jgi:4-hydroxybenzoate polyprenyltransferase